MATTTTTTTLPPKAPFPPSQLDALVPNPGMTQCERIVKGVVQHRRKVLEWVKWMFQADGSLSEAFTVMYCSLDCVTTTTTTTTTTTPTSTSSTTCAVVNYGNVSSKICSSAITWFNLALNVPPGNYRISYVSGALRYGGAVNYSVQDPLNLTHGYKIKYDDGLNEVASPGDTFQSASVATVAAHNTGAFVDFTHTSGKIGIYLFDSPYNDNRGTDGVLCTVNPASTLGAVFKLEKIC